MTRTPPVMTQSLPIEDGKDMGVAASAAALAGSTPSQQAVSALRAPPANAIDAELIAADRAELLLALYDAKLQLQYLESRWPTGTTPAVITRIERALNDALPWEAIDAAISTARGGQ